MVKKNRIELVAAASIFKGVKQALKDIILEAVEHDYLLEIEDDTLGFLNQTPKQIIDHLKIRGGALDFADTKTLITERDIEWDVSENPQIYFNRVKKGSQSTYKSQHQYRHESITRHSIVSLQSFR